MKKELQQLLNEFIERNFTKKQMFTIMEDLYIAEELKKLRDEAETEAELKAYDKRMETIINQTAYDLKIYGLNYELKELIF